MENNARKEIDNFILQKEEEYREIISYVGYSVFDYLSEEIMNEKGTKKLFELGRSHYILLPYVDGITNILEKTTEQNKLKMILPDTLANQYYTNEELMKEYENLTLYILSLCEHFGINTNLSKDISRWKMEYIISMIISKYSDKPLFMDLLNKKLVDEFYLKISYDKHNYQFFSIDLDRYFDSVIFNNEQNIKKAKIKSL